MAEPSTGWWKLTFLRKKKSQPKVLYEIPQELVSNSATGQHGCSAASEAATQPENTELEARLGRIVDKTTASRGRHVKVSHSGRFKEKKKVRTMLTENPDMFPGSGPARDENQRDENQRDENHPGHDSLKSLKEVTGLQVLGNISPQIQEAASVLKPKGGESQLTGGTGKTQQQKIQKLCATLLQASKYHIAILLREASKDLYADLPLEAL